MIFVIDGSSFLKVIEQKIPCASQNTEAKTLQTTLSIVDALLFLINCEQTQHPFWTPLFHWQKYMQNGEYNFFNSSAISHNFNGFVEFFGVFRNNSKFGQPECSALFVSVWPHLKSAYHQITLINPLLCLNSIFPHQKAMFYQLTKFRFFHCFENSQQ